MPTIAQQPIDVQWIVQLVSGQAPTTYPVAFAAAVALSAANANAVVQVARVSQTATSATAPAIPSVQLDQSPASSNFVVQLASAGTSYPLATAITAAYAISTANANAPVNISQVIFTLTAP